MNSLDFTPKSLPPKIPSTTKPVLKALYSYKFL